ncbi:MAG: cytochrome C [Deltaproteobacteria bacterium]|nr:cytochrome C [Deltaproteobacteria bacterium]
MKYSVVSALAVTVISVLFAGICQAVPSGRTLEWKTKSGNSVIVFSGKVHADKGIKCFDCHLDLFRMKQGFADMKMSEIIEGKYCGKCHNGKDAFPTDKQEYCIKCHKQM